jgi:hypothetical protein
MQSAHIGLIWGTIRTHLHHLRLATLIVRHRMTSPAVTAGGDADAGYGVETEAGTGRETKPGA